MVFCWWDKIAFSPYSKGVSCGIYELESSQKPHIKKVPQGPLFLAPEDFN